MGIKNGHLTATPIASANWATGVSYAVGDVIVNSLDIYVCLIAHTSGTFTTDLANQRWQKLNQPAVDENVILNPSARVDASGYSLFQDADQASPVDGTGGSPAGVTWTRTTTNPLSDTGAFLLTKGSGSARGQGVSTDFKIKRSGRAKKHTIVFDYEIVSGTYATGDVTVWVYDITNGVLIQPDSYSIENTIGSTEFKGCTFQTSSNSVNYRLIFHVSSTTSSAFSIQFDGIQISRQIVPYGSVVTDWVSFTPLWQSNGTAPALGNGILTGRWRQVGGAADIEISLTLGSTSTTGTGTSFLTWPSFLALQPLNGSFSEGTCFMYTSTTLTSRIGTPQFYGTERRFGVYLNEAGQWGGGAADWGGAGDTMTITVRGVPVAGWSSSTVVSSSADTRVVACRVINGAMTSIGAANVFPFSTVVFDTHSGMGVPSAGRYTVRVPGFYRVSCAIQHSSGLPAIFVYKNGSMQSAITAVLSGGIATGTATFQFNAGDIVDLRPDTTTTTGTVNFFEIERIQGPSQIAASEVIAVSCVAPSGSVGLENTVVFTTKVFDTHNAYNTSTGVFTAPAPGIYEFKCYGLTNSMIQGTSGALQLYTRINGGGNTHCAWTLGNGANINQSVFGTALISLQAGQTVEFRQTSTTSGTWNSGRYSVIRLGGVM